MTPFGENLLRADRAAGELLARGLADTLKTLNQKSPSATRRGRAKDLVVHASHDYALGRLRDLLSARARARSWTCTSAEASIALRILPTGAATWPAFTCRPILPTTARTTPTVRSAGAFA